MCSQRWIDKRLRTRKNLRIGKGNGRWQELGGRLVHFLFYDVTIPLVLFMCLELCISFSMMERLPLFSS